MASSISSATASSPYTANPTTPPYSDAMEWTTAYMVIHMLSVGSRRYAYILWFIVAFIFILFTVVHLGGLRAGYIGARWNKWALRRRTWRGKRNQKKGIRGKPMSLPPNGQILSLALLFICTLILSFVGADYISPTRNTFNFRRDLEEVVMHSREVTYDASLYYQYQPQYTIAKAWWTSGGRTGLIAFALLPLCILFALKAPPFAIFALPFTMQLHFDKLAWLHRWSARLVWFVSALHVVLWSVQLAKDHQPASGYLVYHYAWQYEKFIYGWTVRNHTCSQLSLLLKIIFNVTQAFGLMTLIMILSLNPIRKTHYEAFYLLHILLVPGTLIMSAIHHPPLWWWCWAALSLWVGERLWRGTWWLHINGFFGGLSASSPLKVASKVDPFPIEAPQTKPTPASGGYPPDVASKTLSQRSSISPVGALAYTPPPGYAHAELLSGATIRLTLITPGFLSWAPGQHFLVNVPSVSKFTTHPFTCASICDEQSPTDAGRAIIVLIRAKSGWTKDLWDHVSSLLMHGENHAPGEKPPNGTIMPSFGVLLRMYVEGPFGSAVRASYGSYSTIMIVAGGSGVSFGLSVLQYVTLCLAGRDGKHLGGKAGGWGRKGFKTRRVRFIWIIREFGECLMLLYISFTDLGVTICSGHIQWCASIIRRCMAMVPPPGLEVNIFVTNFPPGLPPPIRNLPSDVPSEELDHVELKPPEPAFSYQSRSGSSTHLGIEIDVDSPSNSFVDLSYYTGEYGDEEEGEVNTSGPRENYTIDLTNWDGDNELALPGEEALNNRVKKAGKEARMSKALSAMGGPIYGARDTFKDNRYSYRINDPHRMSSSSTTDLLGDMQQPAETEFKVPPTELSTLHIPRLKLQPSSESLLSPGASSSTLSPARPNIPSPISPFNPAPFSDYLPSSTTAQTLSPSQSELHLHQPRLRINELEMLDVTFVAENALQGKPKLDKILADEVRSSSGSTVVACCGPASLNAMVRKSVAAQIDPSRIQRGDERGFVDLVSEEFEY